MRSTRCSIALAALAFLAACSTGDDDELRQWMKDETKELRGRIAPLPQVRPYEPVAYDAGGVVDPFRSSKLAIDSKQQSGSGIQPDLNRAKEPLEAYPLESIKYVGSLVQGKKMYAVVSVDGALHQVRSGNYMGQNFGVVTKITDVDLSLRELVQDPTGDWVERTSTLLLQAKEGK